MTLMTRPDLLTPTPVQRYLVGYPLGMCVVLPEDLCAQHRAEAAATRGHIQEGEHGDFTLTTPGGTSLLYEAVVEDTTLAPFYRQQSSLDGQTWHARPMVPASRLTHLRRLHPHTFLLLASGSCVLLGEGHRKALRFLPLWPQQAQKGEQPGG